MEYFNKKQVGFRINKIRSSLHVTQEEFGKIVDNANKSNVSKWERGVVLPNRNRLMKIAELGGISYNELLYGNPKEYVYNLITHEINNYSSKLWFTMSNYVKNKYDITDETETKEKISELVSDNFDSIYSDIQRTIMLMRANTDNKNASVFNSDELIINKIINFFTVNDISFKEYKELILHAVNSLPTFMTNQTMEQLVTRFIREGYSEEVSNKKALDMLYKHKAHYPINELKTSIKSLYEEYLNFSIDDIYERLNDTESD